MTHQPYKTNAFGVLLDELQPKLITATSHILKDFWKDVGSHTDVPSTPVVYKDFDIFETDTHYLVYVDCPGVQKEDINLEVNASVLSVSYERKHSHDVNLNPIPVLCFRSFGACTCKISLKNLKNIDTSVIGASMLNGVLCIRIPKIQNKSTSRKIAID